MKIRTPLNKLGTKKPFYNLSTKEKGKKLDDIFRAWDECSIDIKFSRKELNKIRGRE